MSVWALSIAGISAVFTLVNLTLTWNHWAADLRIEHGREPIAPGSSIYIDFWDVTAVGNHPLRDVDIELVHWEAERDGPRHRLPVMTDGSSVRLDRGIGGAVHITASFKRGRIGRTHHRDLLLEDTRISEAADVDDF